MIIKRQQGIYNITVDTEKQTTENILNYHKLAFISDIAIDIIDKLKETKEYKHTLKKALNTALNEYEKISSVNWMRYHNMGKLTDQNIDSLDVYNITSKAYEKAFEMFTKRNPNEVVSIMELIEKAEAQGLKLADVLIAYEPVKK